MRVILHHWVDHDDVPEQVTVFGQRRLHRSAHNRRVFIPAFRFGACAWAASSRSHKEKSKPHLSTEKNVTYLWAIDTVAVGYDILKYV